MTGGSIIGNVCSYFFRWYYDYPWFVDYTNGSYGGGVCVVSGGTFSKTGGTIDNTNSANNGKVAYVTTGSKSRVSTAGPGVRLDSNVSGAAGGWE
jgi:hypothetical protein